MRNVILDGVRKILLIYYIEKSYSTAYLNITRLLYQKFYKMMQNTYISKNILKNVPILFS